MRPIVPVVSAQSISCDVIRLDIGPTVVERTKAREHAEDAVADAWEASANATVPSVLPELVCGFLAEGLLLPDATTDPMRKDLRMHIP